MQTVNSLWCQGHGKVCLPPTYEFHTRQVLDCHMLSDSSLRRSYARNSHMPRRSLGSCHTFQLESQYVSVLKNVRTHQSSCTVAHHHTYLTRSHKKIPTVTFSPPPPPVCSRSLYNN
ncbi:hypothetical protein O181_020260 [Austropuccinia psidii MF-1]|uniref:Uncharacterized protein n=1 Tax=Austropuccinia psidii MF-1 TaxID=1389203 RepID=A0A9Q3CC85_9BASI|nr:hypothetical protein [Austropuccinia psidii MF-1]